jgi:general secretion pathway protein G
MVEMLQVLTYLLCIYLVFKGFEIFQIALTSSREQSRKAGIVIGVLAIVISIVAAFGFAFWTDKQAASLGSFAQGTPPPRAVANSKVKITVAKAQIAAFQTALGAYKLDTGSFPMTDQGLQALRTQPAGVINWNGPYLPSDIPMDPWNHPYIYKYPGEHGDEPDILSYGADGQPGGEGENADIVSWK